MRINNPVVTPYQVLELINENYIVVTDILIKHGWYLSNEPILGDWIKKMSYSERISLYNDLKQFLNK